MGVAWWLKLIMHSLVTCHLPVHMWNKASNWMLVTDCSPCTYWMAAHYVTLAASVVGMIDYDDDHNSN